ncbi:hypothetical protein GCM10026983_30270 [Gracilibacillus alcaliphilus]
MTSANYVEVKYFQAGNINIIKGYTDAINYYIETYIMIGKKKLDILGVVI